VNCRFFALDDAFEALLILAFLLLRFRSLVRRWYGHAHEWRKCYDNAIDWHKKYIGVAKAGAKSYVCREPRELKRCSAQI
jgi:hypothetical protein